MFARWQNFVQRREIESPRRLGLLNLVYRAPILEDADQKNVTSHVRPFVSYSETKIAFGTRNLVRLSRGQHALINGPKRVLAADAEIFHLPLRYRSEIIKRGLNYEPRRAAVREGPEESWQSAFHAKVVADGQVDEVWAANSAASNGTLDVHGRAMPLVSLTTGCDRFWCALGSM